MYEIFRPFSGEEDILVLISKSLLSDLHDTKFGSEMIVASEECFIFPVRCFLSKLERVECD